MTRLEELIISLATVIVRYHDSYNAATAYVTKGATEALTRKSSFDYSKKLFEQNELQSKLTEIVTKCPKNDRGPFLDFIKDELLVLREQLNKAEPFTNEEFELYQKQITQLVVDFIKLLNTNKGTTYDVHCNKPVVKISLGGLNNVGYGLLASSPCKSGQLLTEEILTRFNFSTVEEATEWAKELCNEHKYKLLATSAQAHVTRNTELEVENKSLQETSNQSKATLAALFLCTQKMESDLKQSQTELSEAQIQLATLLEDLDALQKENESLRVSSAKSLTTTPPSSSTKATPNPLQFALMPSITKASQKGLFSTPFPGMGLILPPTLTAKRSGELSPPKPQIMNDSSPNVNSL